MKNSIISDEFYFCQCFCAFMTCPFLLQFEVKEIKEEEEMIFFAPTKVYFSSRLLSNGVIFFHHT
jgi:hypothetical protein